VNASGNTAKVGSKGKGGAVLDVNESERTQRSYNWFPTRGITSPVGKAVTSDVRRPGMRTVT
jgi:hypothetical protein